MILNQRRAKNKRSVGSREKRANRRKRQSERWEISEAFKVLTDAGADMLSGMEIKHRGIFRSYYYSCKALCWFLLQEQTGCLGKKKKTSYLSAILYCMCECSLTDKVKSAARKKKKKNQIQHLARPCDPDNIITSANYGVVNLERLPSDLSIIFS